MSDTFDDDNTAIIYLLNLRHDDNNDDNIEPNSDDNIEPNNDDDDIWMCSADDDNSDSWSSSVKRPRAVYTDSVSVSRTPPPSGTNGLPPNATIILRTWLFK